MTTDDTTGPTVEVTVGRLGAGERTVTLEPGDEWSHAFDEPSYVSVSFPEQPESEMPEAGDTTFEQEKRRDDNREVPNDKLPCQSCGHHYKKNLSRCPECGQPNPDG